MDDLRDRLSTRVQLTTDGHKPYLEAVGEAFGADVDYAMLVKLYGEPTGTKGHERKYSPSECTGTRKRRIEGSPDEAHISTSYVERSNLSLRMGNRRFTRLTNAFSKKLENHCHSLALYFTFYNFVRQHKSLGGISPAMAAGIEKRLREMADLLALVGEWEKVQRGISN
ncbi:MAG: IS1 family transposase [Geminicoccaceae bacterium]|nr:IS1 family transposase [Geminicoccaceae bacterium]